MRNLFLFIAAMSLHVNAATDNRLNYQMGLSRMGDQKGNPLKKVRNEGKDLLDAARNETNGISQEDYNFLKGTSAFAASGAEWAHLETITGNGVTILLLENSGINHHDIRSNVEADSPKSPTSKLQYKLDHGSGMASLIHAIAPDSKIRVRPINEWSDSLANVRIINASFGGNEENGFRNTFSAIKVDNTVPLIVKSAGNHQQNLSEHPYTKNCNSLIPFTIFAGNLRQDYKGKTSSGIPGVNSQFQNSFLWVIADNVLIASGPDGSTQYSPGTGTSNAAAILSGAAALVLSKYPTLSTADLKEILLESADRDIFQLFGSGYKALHISDHSVDFYQKQTQYKKTNKDSSILDFAEDLARSNDTALAADIVGGARGVSNRAATSVELEQFTRILKKIKEAGHDKLLSLSPDTAKTESERMHRERIQELLAGIPENTDSKSLATKEKIVAYDPAFWGKGILNIKNALLYAKLKMKYPTMSPYVLRERMLEIINAQQQYYVKKIQKVLKSRTKATELKKEEWDKRQGLTINTSLPGRQYNKVAVDPLEPVIPEQADEDRLRDLGITLPEVSGRKQLNVISDDAYAATTSSGPAREIAPIPDSEIPTGASAKLREFLKADKENLIKAFNDFSDQIFKPLMDLEAPEIAKRLQSMNLNVPFSANRVIYKDGNSNWYSCIFYHDKVTAITLFYDFLRLKIALGTLTEDKAKIINIAMDLLTPAASNLEKSEILSLLKQYSQYNDTQVHDFIINNDLLSVPFREIEIKTYYNNDDDNQPSEKRVKFENKMGIDIINSWDLVNILDKNPSTQAKNILKRFFKTLKGQHLLVQIAIKQPIEESISKQDVNYNSLRFGTDNIDNDVTAEGKRVLSIIFRDAERELPKMFNILSVYADQTDIPALISAMNHYENQVRIEISTKELTDFVNASLETILPTIFK